jgi:hypothetical protein
LKVLFDHNVNRRLRRHLIGHDIKTTQQMGWDRLENGVLLQAAAPEFDAFLSFDKKMEYEQNLLTLPLPVILVDSISNALPASLPFVPFILALLNSPLDRAMYIIKADGTVVRLAAPRPK